VSPVLGGATGGGAASLLDRSTWATATAYAVGDVVTQSGQRYACCTAHTSGTFSTDLAATKWVPLDPGASVPLATTGQTPAQEPVLPGSAANAGSLAYAARADHVHPSAGLYWAWGSGADGDLAFDGTTAVVLVTPFGNQTITPSGSVYSVSVPIAARNLTITNGVTIAVSQGCTVYVQGTLTCPSGTATIHADGTAGAVNGTAGAARGALGAPATGVGGAGNTGAGGSGGSIGAPTDQWAAAAAGAGGTGTSGAGGSTTGGVLSNRSGHFWLGRDPLSLLRGVLQGTDASTAGLLGSLGGSGGGGGGGGDGTNKGGGGGSGGGLVIVNAKIVSGAVNIRAAGGAGGTPSTGNCGGGGGGGGGYAFLNSTDLTAWTGAVTAPGGAAGTGVGTGTNGTAGSAGIALSTTWK
jgi:hypothetical protein